MLISFFIAKRYARKQDKTTLVYRLSRLSCYSTALGTTILLLVLSTMNGMANLLSSLFYSYSSALKIEAKKGKAFVNNQKLKESITHIPNVKSIVEILEETSLIRFKGQQAIIMIKGVSTNFSESDFYKNCTRMDSTTFFEERDENYQAIMDINISRLLQLDTHSRDTTIKAFYPRKNSLNASINQQYKKGILEISGLFSTHKMDGKYIIAPINFVEKLTDRLDERTSWEIVLKNEDTNLDKTKASIQKLLPSDLKISSRYEQNGARQKAIFIERLSVSFIFSLVLLLASLHIFFMLCMLVLEKKKDIAILSAIGTKPDQIGKLFFYSGLLVSMEGTLYGLIIAWILGFLQQKFGMITLTTLRNTGSVAYPIDMCGNDFLYTAILTILFSSLGSLWPAKQAMKLARKNVGMC
jgi:lipoprotein-releasing system permease protein